MVISFFNNGVTQVVPSGTMTDAEIIKQIKDCKYEDQINICRKFLQDNIEALTNPDEDVSKAAKRKYQKIKAPLPNWTISGVFKTLDTKIDLSDKLDIHTGLICLDVDDIIEINQEMGSTILEAEKERYAAYDFVYFVFVSPSGTGLKVVCAIDIESIAEHNEAFNQILEVLKADKLPQYQIKSIEKCRDITRRCFVSYDPDIYVNSQYIPFKPKPKAPEKKQPANARKQPVASPGNNPDTHKCKLLAGALVDAKIDITKDYPQWVEIALSLATLGEDGREIFHTVSSVYPGYNEEETDEKFTHCIKTGFAATGKDKGVTIATFIKLANDAIKTLPKIETGKEITDLLTQNFADLDYRAVFGVPDDDKAPLVIWKGNFWVETRRIKKDGEEVKTFNLEYVKFRKFLEAAGFYKLVTKYKNKPNTYEYVLVQNNIVKSVRADEIENHIMEWVRHYGLEELENKLTQGSSRYFSEHTFRKLSVRAFDFKRDTRTSAFYYFRNCWVKVTSDKITSHPYEELENYIWYSQIIDRDFTYCAENEDSVFNQFLHFATYGKRIYNTDKYVTSLEVNPLNTQRVSAVMTGIGYCLHGFKDPTKAKSFNIFDGKVSRDKRPEGRSGKSLTFKGIAQIIPTVEIDATNIKLNDNLTLSEVSHDTRFIYFNDANENFPFIRLFHMLTESMTSKRLYLDPIVIPFETSPKIAVNTNWVLKGDGGSFRARQHNVEYTDFFTPEYSPRDHFKCQFFSDDWSAEEWNKFFSVMFDYVSLYLLKGLVQFPEPNFEYRKLIASVPEDFVKWFEDELPKDKREIKKEHYENFKKLYSDFDQIKQNTFSKWLTRCADHFEYDINKGHMDGRDRVDSIDYITITKK